ncbi:MAG: hypothetical protein MI923_08885 [Phycisphaerales bacterium]|nr:hypothetical protein [Phycisphaerales bacterium]
MFRDDDRHDGHDHDVGKAQQRHRQHVLTVVPVVAEHVDGRAHGAEEALTG